MQSHYNHFYLSFRAFSKIIVDKQMKLTKTGGGQMFLLNIVLRLSQFMKCHILCGAVQPLSVDIGFHALIQGMDWQPRGLV